MIVVGHTSPESDHPHMSIPTNRTRDVQSLMRGEYLLSRTSFQS